MTVVVVRLLSTIAPKLQLVDRPGGHKKHQGAIPVVGGVGMYAGLALVSAVWTAMPNGPPPMPGVGLLFGGILVLTGLMDDRVGLSVQMRVGGQVLAILGMIVYGRVIVWDLGALVSQDLLVLGVFATPFTVIAAVGTINAVNLMDGVDGLAGSLAAVVFALLAVASALAGHAQALLVLLMLSGVVAGFLVFNLRCRWRPRAALFMGDAGSLFLGFMITWFVVSLSQGPERVIAPVTALWIFAIPLFETVAAMVRRIGHRRSPFSADNGHIHHLFMEAHFEVSTTVAILAGVQLIFGLVGLAGYLLGISEAAMFYSFLGLFALYARAVVDPQRMVAYLASLREAWLGGQAHPAEIVVPGLSRETLPSLFSICQQYEELGGAARLSVWEMSGSNDSRSYYGVITVGSSASAHRVMQQLRHQSALPLPLDIRLFAERTGDRRAKTGARGRWPCRERRIAERRSHANRLLWEGDDLSAPTLQSRLAWLPICG